MDTKHKAQLKKIMGEMKCSKHFKCHKSSFKEFCKARDIGLGEFLLCLEEDPFKCDLAVSFGNSYYCKCPLRRYALREMMR